MADSDKKKDALLVLSGGMDSSSMLYEYAPEIALAVSFDYGANHGPRELECAARNCARLGIPHVIIPLDFMARYFDSALLSGADAIPEAGYAESNMKSTVVPFRNGIMLAIAAGLAESRGLARVMIANHSGDHDIYPDCRPGFIEAMSRATAAGTYPGITVCAPYTLLSKADIARRGADAGLDFASTYSCYKGGEHHCGRCATCIERREALRAAGIPDPTIYDSDYTH